MFTFLPFLVMTQRGVCTWMDKYRLYRVCKKLDTVDFCIDTNIDCIKFYKLDCMEFVKLHTIVISLHKVTLIKQPSMTFSKSCQFVFTKMSFVCVYLLLRALSWLTSTKYCEVIIALKKKFNLLRLPPNRPLSWTLTGILQTATAVSLSGKQPHASALGEVMKDKAIILVDIVI